ncbi:hypothetical protein [Nocardia sp. NPDC057455]|uniref:hypothetical protein n=1 Tax=Nocardia sp. NPDC057455 TaxID=3346138 RepID=UPI00367270E4
MSQLRGHHGIVPERRPQGRFVDQRVHRPRRLQRGSGNQFENERRLNSVGSISPQSYESAAKECYDLSEKFQTVYNAMQRVLLETSAMAGGYQAVKTWSKAYDDRAGAVVLVATSFARALQHFGDVWTAAGYNWKCAEYKANRDPNKGGPPSLPSGFPSELPYGSGIVNGVASSGTYSRGLETDWTELQDKVTALVSGGEVPDGDTDKLARAATAWKTFAQCRPALSRGGGDTAGRSARGGGLGSPRRSWPSTACMPWTPLFFCLRRMSVTGSGRWLSEDSHRPDLRSG